MLVLKKEITHLGKSNNGMTILARKIKSVRVHSTASGQTIHKGGLENKKTNKMTVNTSL